MANPSFNKSIQATSTGGATSLSTSAFTGNAGSNRFLEVTVMVGAATGQPPVGVNWGGQPLTKRADLFIQANTNISKWYLKEANFPSGASGVISAGFPATLDELGIMAALYNDVDQTNPYRNTAITSAATAATSSNQLAVACGSTDIVTTSIYVFKNSGGGTGITLSGAGNSRVEIDSLGGLGFELGGIGDIVGGTSTASMGWTFDNNNADNSMMIGDAIQYLAGAVSSLSATHFRARNDNGDEISSSWLASEDTNFQSPSDSNLRIRYQINVSGDPGAKNFRLEYKETSASSWSVVQNHLTASASYGAEGGAGFTAAAGATITATYPTGITTNSALLLIVHQKPSTANLGTVTTPTGWTLRGQILSAGNYATTIGADTGNTNLFVYTKDVVSGTESGTFTISVGTNNVAWADIIRMESNVACTWTYAVVLSSDITGNASVSVGFGSDPGATAGDILIAGMGYPTDIGNGTQITAEGLQYPGVTLGTVTEISEPFSANGNDIGAFLCYATVTAGTSTGVPLLSATSSGTVTNIRGPAFLFRARPTAIQYPIELGDSSNISAGGTTPTTRQLTLPSGYDTSAFQAGYISDDANPVPALDLALNTFTELEWSIKAISTQGGASGKVYNLRVTDSGTSLDSYLTSAIWTIGATTTNVSASVGVLSGSYSLAVSNLSADITLGVNPISATYSIPSAIPSADALVLVVPLSATYSIATPTVSGTSTGNNLTVSASLLSATYSLPSPQINTGVSIQVDVLSAAYSLPNPTINNGASINVGVLSASYSIPSPQVNFGNSVSVSFLSASYNVPTPNVSAAANVAIGVLSATYSLNQTAGWDNIYVPSPFLASYSLPIPTIIYGSDSNVSVGVLSATYSLSSALVTVDKTVNVNSISGVYNIGSSVSISNTVEVSASLESSYSIPSPTISANALVQVGVLSAAYSIPSPTINFGYVLSVGLLSGAYSLFVPNVVTGGSALVQVGVLSAAYSLSSPQINTNSNLSINSLSGSYSIPSPQVNLGNTIILNVLSAAYSIPSPQVSLGCTVSVNSLSAVYSIPNPNVVTGMSNTIQVGVLSASYSIPSPQVNFGCTIILNVVSGAYSLPVPNVVTGGSSIIQVGVLSASYSIPSHQVNFDCLIHSSLLSGSNSISSPQINYGDTISVGSLSATYSIPSPQVNTGHSSTISVGSLSATYSTQNPLIGCGITIIPGTMVGTINISSPIIRRDKIVLAGQLSGRYFVLNPSLGSGAIIKLRRIEGY